MPITDADVDRYLHEILPARPAPITRLEEALEERRFPTVGPVVGRVLHQLVAMTGARRALELGSGPGYAAWWIATALPADGSLVCTDLKPENAADARALFAETGLAERVRFLEGDALEILDGLEGGFDFVFCDVDKHDYPRALDAVVPRLEPGGLFVVDNVLWGGDVARENPERSDTHAIREFTRRAIAHPELVTTILPLRDGISVSWKRPGGAA